jgi:hypothetical protein
MKGWALPRRWTPGGHPPAPPTIDLAGNTTIVRTAATPRRDAHRRPRRTGRAGHSSVKRPGTEVQTHHSVRHGIRSRHSGRTDRGGGDAGSGERRGDPFDHMPDARSFYRSSDERRSATLHREPVDPKANLPAVPSDRPDLRLAPPGLRAAPARLREAGLGPAPPGDHRVLAETISAAPRARAARSAGRERDRATAPIACDGSPSGPSRSNDSAPRTPSPAGRV